MMNYEESKLISINEQTAILAIDKASVNVVDIKSPDANITCQLPTNEFVGL
jgi:hypothetical protein